MPASRSGARESVRTAGLVFSSGCEPGIRRESRVDGRFTYRREGGGRMTKADLRRIEALKIPPAWTDVWICASPDGHLQATGRDAKGRKQYRYHRDWTALRDQDKFGHLLEFGDALPAIRKAVDEDSRRPRLDARKVVAIVVAVMDEVFVRVGGAQYARANASFGVTTLRDEHADVGSRSVRLRFRGKAGKELDVCVENPRIARAVRRMRDLPGEELFQYVDAGGVQRAVDAAQVNSYLQDIAGTPVTSKDFRTWAGSLLAAGALHGTDRPDAPERAIAEAVRQAALALGNTPAVCKRSYIHPGILDLYRSGGFAETWRDAASDEPRRAYLREDERVFLGMLRRL